MSFKGLLKVCSFLLIGLIKVCSFLLIGLIAVASAALVAYKSPTDASQQDRLISVEVTQLPLENGAWPVELRCEDAHSSALNRLDGISCLAINNTRKKISAFAVVYSVVVDAGAGMERETNLLTSDYAIHPDISEAMRQHLFPPGEARRVATSGPVTFENGTVSGVEIQIDYVEFEDKTSTGPNIQGSKMVHSMREGAAKYKAWLVRQYKRGGLDEQSMTTLLDATDLPAELNFNGDPDLSEGARLYRRVLRSIYTAKGIAELKRYLSR